MAAVARGLPDRDAARSRRAAPVRRRPAASRADSSSRAGSPSACSSGRWPTETERTWQLLRRAAREAGDWITVDASPTRTPGASSDEPYRWAELEQLVYSPSRWERRLVGSTIATMTHGARGKAPRAGDRRRRALPILGQLIGDAEPDVQKALGLGAIARSPQVDRDRDDRRARARRPSAPSPTTTATGPGSSATRCPSSIRPPPRGLREPARRHPQATRRPVDLAPPPPRPPRFGPPARPPLTTPSHRCG